MDKIISTFYIIGDAKLLLRKRRNIVDNSVSYDYYNEVIDRMIPDSNSLLEILAKALRERKATEVTEVEWAKEIQRQKKTQHG